MVARATSGARAAAPPALRARDRLIGYHCAFRAGRAPMRFSARSLNKAAGCRCARPRTCHARFPSPHSRSHQQHQAHPLRAGRLRGLFRLFFSREIRTRYLGSSTGLAWALIHPLALLGVYWFVFTSVFRAGNLGSQSFLPFVAVALWPWLAAQEALSRATVSLAGYAGLIRKAAFPQEAIVYASVAATFALNLAGYVVVLGVLKLFGEPLRLEGLVVAVPLWLVLMLGDHRPGARAGVAAGLRARRRARADADPDDHDVPDADPVSAGAGAGKRPSVGCGQSVRLAGDAHARRAARRAARVPAGRCARRRRRRCACSARGLWMFRRLAPHFEDFL